MKLISLLLLACSATLVKAYPYCDNTTATFDCTPEAGATSGSYCMNYWPHTAIDPPYLCHGASPNASACGKPHVNTSVPREIAEAYETYNACIAAGNGTSHPDFSLCSMECQDAFVTFITYGDRYSCFAFEAAGTSQTFYQQKRSTLNAYTEDAGCTLVGGKCFNNTEFPSFKCLNDGQCEANTTLLPHFGDPYPVYQNFCNCSEGYSGLHCEMSTTRLASLQEKMHGRLRWRRSSSSASSRNSSVGFLTAVFERG